MGNLKVKFKKETEKEVILVAAESGTTTNLFWGYRQLWIFIKEVRAMGEKKKYKTQKLWGEKRGGAKKEEWSKAM